MDPIQAIAATIRCKNLDERTQRAVSEALQLMHEVAVDDETRRKIAKTLDPLNGAIYRRVVERGIAGLENCHE